MTGGRPPAPPGGPPCDTRLTQKWRSRVRGGIAAAQLLVLVASCSMPTCRPLTIVVVQKEERARLESVPHGIRTTETGRLEQDRRNEIVRDYWVRAQGGTWHPVLVDRYRVAEVGRPLQLCR